MKIHGFCTKCKKIKRVNVKVPRRGVQLGTCDDCERASQRRGRIT